MGSRIPRASLVPGMLPDDVLPDSWSESLIPYFEARPVARATPGPAPLPTMQLYHLGQALFLDTTFGAQRFRRDSGWMARHDDVDHVMLQFFVRGTNTVVNGDQVYTEQPGNIYAVNLSRSIEAQSTDADVVQLVFPRQVMLNELPHLADARGALFDPNSASARVFCDHLLSLRSHLATATEDEGARIVEGTLGLLDALVRHNDIQSDAARNATLGAICRHIDRNLRDPELDVAALCAKFRCSRATLYRLFQPMGGVREHIQRRRLAACFKAISTPAQAHRKIFDIALDYGFVSASHFSTLFRAHFNMTPREAREIGTRPDRLPVLPAEGRANDLVETMQRWAQDLATGKLAAIRT